MPLIQKRKKLNDFLYGREQIYYGQDPVYDLTSKIHLHVTFSSTVGGKYYCKRETDRTIYVYHIEKRRARWIQVNRNKIIDGKRTTVSERVCMRHWKVRVFAFPAEMVKHVEQHARHFTIELK